MERRWPLKMRYQLQNAYGWGQVMLELQPKYTSFLGESLTGAGCLRF